MDIEMPVMDGITAAQGVLPRQRLSILMYSSLTPDGAQATSDVTSDALETGVLDFLLVLIGTSTGGPIALQKVLTQLHSEHKKWIC